MNARPDDNKPYLPIVDWSLEGRRAIVAAHRDAITLLLDEAFVAFADNDSLADYGFRSKYPIEEATEWVLKRFETVHSLDPKKIRGRNHSLRLFTVTGFWLSQKVTVAGYRARRKARSHQTVAMSAEPNGFDNHMVLDGIKNQLVDTLQRLHACTCNDVVTFWLEGTKRWRRAWFDWPGADDNSVDALLSDKKKSLLMHDAMFRFCLILDEPILKGGDESEVLERTTLSPCENKPPYRVPDREVAKLFAKRGLKTQETSRLRKAGAGLALIDLCERLATIPDWTAEKLRWYVVRQSIGLTTLHALDIDGQKDLASLINSLPDVKEIAEWTTN